MGRMTGRLCALVTAAAVILASAGRPSGQGLTTGSIAGRVTDSRGYYAAPGVYVWDVPDLPTTRCRIRISDAGSGGLADVSDGAFSNSSK